MIQATVKLQRMEVESFSLKDGAEVKIFFNDGTNKALVVGSNLSNVDEDASKIMARIRAYEKEINISDCDDNFLDAFVNVKIEEEDKMQGKIAMFLSKLKESSRRLRSSAGGVGYLDQLNLVKSLKTDLK